MSRTTRAGIREAVLALFVVQIVSETQMHPDAFVASLKTPALSKCICVSPAIEVSSCCTPEARGSRSEVDTEAALGHELALELHQATEPLQAFDIGLALARFEHAHAVDE